MIIATVIGVVVTVLVIALIEEGIARGWLDVGDDETLYYMDGYYTGSVEDLSKKDSQDNREEKSEVKRIEADI